MVPRDMAVDAVVHGERSPASVLRDVVLSAWRQPRRPTKPWSAGRSPFTAWQRYWKGGISDISSSYVQETETGSASPQCTDSGFSEECTFQSRLKSS